MSEISNRPFFTKLAGRSLSRARVVCCAALLAFTLSACETPTNTTNTNVSNTAANTSATPAQTAQQNQNAAASSAAAPVTLPVLDAMFSDETFAAELKQKLGLTDEQIARLRDAAREATGNLSETATDEATGSTAEATQRAQEQIRQIVGDEKTGQLAQFVSERWASGTGEEKANNAGAASPSSNNAASSARANSVPSDTRIVVNAPAYRMDLFRNGQLVRSYKVGIGYPEFPLPTGTRTASTIIFNPTWTPPDEPWVRGKLKPGQRVEAGSSMNPLGPIKIPIGSPSLIHGGKSPARLGTFASHGCVGLTNPQVQDFTLALAELSGTRMTEQDILGYAKNKTETKNVKLSNSIPVELRYETIVVEDGRLKIYRDVYERGTNTEENLRRVLESNGVSFDQLSEEEKKQSLEGLSQMARNAQGKTSGGAQTTNNNANAANGNANRTANRNARNQSASVTRGVTGKKEVVIEIAALKGKGYPAAVDLNTGGKSKRPLSAATSNSNNSNQQNAAQTNTGATTNGNTNRAQTNTATGGRR